MLFVTSAQYETVVGVEWVFWCNFPRDSGPFSDATLTEFTYEYRDFSTPNDNPNPG